MWLFKQPCILKIIDSGWQVIHSVYNYMMKPSFRCCHWNKYNWNLPLSSPWHNKFRRMQLENPRTIILVQFKHWEWIFQYDGATGHTASLCNIFGGEKLVIHCNLLFHMIQIHVILICEDVTKMHRKQTSRNYLVCGVSNLQTITWNCCVGCFH